MTQSNAPDPAGGPEKTYFDALRAGTFQIQHCGDCQRHVFYPRMVCPHCGSGVLSWVQPSGKGTVYSTTIVRRKPEAGGDYNVALIDLAEGVRLMSRVHNMAPADVAIGMAVRAEVIRQGDEPLLVFRREGDQA